MTGHTRRCDAAYPHLRHRVYGGAGGSWNCPGVRIPDEVRLNPVTTRRKVLAVLRASAAGVHGLISRWDVTGLMINDVPRRVEQFPENSPAMWRALVARLGNIIDDLSALQRMAMRRYEHALDTDSKGE